MELTATAAASHPADQRADEVNLNATTILGLSMLTTRGDYKAETMSGPRIWARDGTRGDHKGETTSGPRASQAALDNENDALASGQRERRPWTGDKLGDVLRELPHCNTDDSWKFAQKYVGDGFRSGGVPYHCIWPKQANSSTAASERGLPEAVAEPPRNVRWVQDVALTLRTRSLTQTL